MAKPHNLQKNAFTVKSAVSLTLVATHDFNVHIRFNSTLFCCCHLRRRRRRGFSPFIPFQVESGAILWNNSSGLKCFN